jgi:predicted  nucleic acid-binding Zn-ribbon protein
VVDAQGTLIGLVTDTDLLAAAWLGGDRGDEEGPTMNETSSSEFRSWIERELAELHRMREELAVQVRLGKAEAKDRWKALEDAFEALEGRVRRVTRAADEPVKELREDARKLARDLREGYRRIRDSL